MNTKNSLESLFGSKERWRLIKMFLLNEEDLFTMRDIRKRTKVNGKNLSGLVTQLSNIKFISERKRKGKKFFKTNEKFPFFHELKQLVIKSNVHPQCESLNRIKNLGNIKLAVVTGLFIDEPKARTDLLIVGDGISKAKMKHLLEDLEAEMGREVDYSLMDLTEFKYRANMFDKFIMEIMESPHEIVVNKLPGELYHLRKGKKN